MIIRRVINSLTRRYVELMQKSFEPLNTALPTAQGAWYVDAGLRYQGAPATIMSGLDHLEGMDVYGLADGSKFASKRVTGGSITLEQSASDVCIGLPLRAFIRSLPIEIDTPQGTSKGKIKRVHHIVLDMVDAYGGRIRVNEGPWSEIFESGDLGYGQSPTLFTGSKRISVEHASDTSIYVELECNDPYPFTLAGWTVEMNVEPA